MSAPPVVGIGGHGYVAPRHFGDLPVTGAPTSYVDALLAAGAAPVVLPPGMPVEALARLDGLVLIGGGDVDPSAYGGSPGAARDVDPDLDATEIGLVRGARELALPTLGVCRGLQVLVVATGGTLVDLGPDEPHLLVPRTRGHHVSALPGSVVAARLGLRTPVNSLHRQAVASHAPEWTLTAVADDGVVEALEWHDQDAWPAVGVQWHPELDDTGPALFGWLVTAAMARVRTPGPRLRTPAGPAAREHVLSEQLS